VKRELAMHCHIIAYCLMPNHDHLLIMTPEKNEFIQSGFGRMQALARKIGTLQSSYTRALNKQNKSSGSVFRQKAKAKLLDNPDYQYTCFHYIHQKPLRSGLVKHLKDWEFSSYTEYAGLKKEPSLTGNWLSSIWVLHRKQNVLPAKRVPEDVLKKIILAL